MKGRLHFACAADHRELATMVGSHTSMNRSRWALGGEALQSTRPDVTDESVAQSWEVHSMLVCKSIQRVLSDELPRFRHGCCAGKARLNTHPFRNRARSWRRVTKLGPYFRCQRQLAGTCEGQWLYATLAGNRHASGPQNSDSIGCMKEVPSVGSKKSVDLSCMCSDKNHWRRALLHILNIRYVFQA